MRTGGKNEAETKECDYVDDTRSTTYWCFCLGCSVQAQQSTVSSSLLYPHPPGVNACLAGTILSWQVSKYFSELIPLKLISSEIQQATSRTSWPDSCTCEPNCQTVTQLPCKGLARAPGKAWKSPGPSEESRSMAPERSLTVRRH